MAQSTTRARTIVDNINIPASPDHNSTATSSSTHIILIPGNPGLISFYTTFAQQLRAALLTGNNTNIFSISGSSLAGFEVASSPPAEPVHLQQQIEQVERYVAAAVSSSEEPGNAAGRLNVILIGHSVGSYILLEVLRRYYEQRNERELPYRIIGGICLFPTVVDIAESKSGRRVTPLLSIPGLVTVVATVVRVAMSLMPLGLLRWLVGTITGFPEDARETVTAYLRSPMGVRETLFMARDEMREIKTDRWDEEVWGSAKAAAESGEAAKLFCYFGEEDHWVSKRTREGIIAARGSSEEEAWKPKMEVDTNGVPHGFCIRPEHSKIVAEKCAQYIDTIVKADR